MEENVYVYFMFNNNVLRTFCIVALCIIFVPTKSLLANTYWQCTKEYTGTLAEGAKDAAVAVGETLQTLGDAREVIEQAQPAVESLKGSSVVMGSAAGAAIVNATSATLATAGEAAAATAVVALKGVAIAGAAAVGTLGGQGLGWLISSCWDPVCGIEAIDTTVEDIYTPATDEEIQAIIPTLLTTVGASNASGEPLAISDFEAAGDDGEVALQFISESVGIFLNAARGAASATAERYDETLNAVEDLKEQLSSYPTTISNFAAVLQSMALISPIGDITDAKNDYLTAIGGESQTEWLNAIEEITMAGGDEDDLATFNDAISAAGNALGNVLVNVSALSYPPLVTTGETAGAFSDFTLDGYNQFISDCTTNGSSCLPVEEITIVEQLLTTAGVTIPTIASVGVSIAEYDAGDICDDSGTVVMFQTAINPSNTLVKAGSNGALTLADILSQSVTDPSSSDVESVWLNIDLEDSPVTIAARAAGGTDTASSSGCSLTMQSGKHALQYIIPLVLFIFFVALIRSKNYS